MKAMTHNSFPTPVGEPLRVAVVADNCSEQFGGEAALPLQYFRLLRRRGIDTCLVAHARTRPELDGLFPDERENIYYVSDTLLHRVLFRLGRLLPRRIDRCTFRFLSTMLTHWMQARLLRRLVRRRGIAVVHQPVPVSPTEPSLIQDVGAAVVIGPMNGGMNFPPAFGHRENRAERGLVQAARRIADLANRMLPGKARAQVLLVSNPRTRELVPRCVRAPVLHMHENGVELKLWRPAGQGPRVRDQAPGAGHLVSSSLSQGPGVRDQAPGAGHLVSSSLSLTPSSGGAEVRFVYLGRLVDWKGVDLLLHAWASASVHMAATLEIIGDGSCRAELEDLHRRLGLAGSVRFSGWLPREACPARLSGCDVLVLPSLMECGGAVVLEAMAMGLAVIATRWGGPVDYLDNSCGILVPPDSVDGFVAGLARAMRQMHDEPELRRRMGQSARRKVLQRFDWERKLDRMLEIYRYAMSCRGSGAPPGPLRLSPPLAESSVGVRSAG